MEEIRQINEKRAALPKIPLAVQISHIEKLMDGLDGRVKQLETVYSKTSLPHILKKSIAELVQLSRELFISRERNRGAAQLTADEKQARRERQLTRYGRAYRTGLHEQIIDMKNQLQRLEETAASYKRYKSFVDIIDQELLKLPSITPDKKDEAGRPQKTITDKEFSLKLTLKGQVIREAIPAQFRARLPTDRGMVREESGLVKTFKSSNKTKTIGDIFNLKPDVKIRSEPTRENWFSPATAKTSLLQEAIVKKIGEGGVQVVSLQMRRHDPKTLTGEFNLRGSNDTPAGKTASYGAVREKVRLEAVAARERVPPQYRARPYHEPLKVQVQPATVRKWLLLELFKPGTDEADIQPAPLPLKPGERMAEVFNEASGATGQPEHYKQKLTIKLGFG